MHAATPQRHQDHEQKPAMTTASFAPRLTLVDKDLSWCKVRVLIALGLRKQLAWQGCGLTTAWGMILAMYKTSRSNTFWAIDPRPPTPPGALDHDLGPPGLQFPAPFSVSKCVTHAPAGRGASMVWWRL